MHPQALARIDGALDLATTTGERWYLPELHRHRAELLLATNVAPEVVADAARRALDLAREQGSVSFERRAAAFAAQRGLC